MGNFPPLSPSFHVCKILQDSPPFKIFQKRPAAAVNRIPATHGRGRGGGGLDVVGWREADEREEHGDGEQESRRRAEDGEKVAPVAHG